jgi:hypothetical protein
MKVMVLEMEIKTLDEPVSSCPLDPLIPPSRSVAKTINLPEATATNAGDASDAQ